MTDYDLYIEEFDKIYGNICLIVNTDDKYINYSVKSV